MLSFLSCLPAAFDDDEDDIMIVEEKDALDVPDQIEYVAEEVIIDEANDHGNSSDNNRFHNHYSDIICVSPNVFDANRSTTQESSSFNDNSPDSIDNLSASKAHDNNNRNELPAEQPESTNTSITATTAATAPCVPATINTNTVTNESEPIYLSDSLSCFDSDSDTQPEDLDLAIAQHKVETNHGNADRLQSDAQSDQHAMDDNDELDALNLSTDDVIIVQQDEYVEPIEVDQSDSDDERFAEKYAFEPFIESDSQTVSDTVNDTKMASIQRCGSAVGAGGMASSVDEITTDADDDSIEMDRRGTRSRRGKMLKNYSIRRTYARRKLRSETESPSSMELNQEAKNENCSDDNGQKGIESALRTGRMDGRLSIDETQMKSTQCNRRLTDGAEYPADDQCDAMNVTLTKMPRTYVRRKGATPKSASCPSNEKSSAISMESPSTPNENTTSSSNSNDAVTKPAVAAIAASNQVPRKRGRPRKNPIVVENNISDALKFCGITKTDDLSTLPPPPSPTVEQAAIETGLQREEEVMNGPTEQFSSTEAELQKSIELPLETIPNASMDHMPSEIDQQREDTNCEDERVLVGSSKKISTECVQHETNNDENIMEIEDTIADESTNQIDLANKTTLNESSSPTEINHKDGNDCKNNYETSMGKCVCQRSLIFQIRIIFVVVFFQCLMPSNVLKRQKMMRKVAIVKWLNVQLFN